MYTVHAHNYVQMKCLMFVRVSKEVERAPWCEGYTVIVMAAACRDNSNDQDFADERLVTILHELFLCNLQENFRPVKVWILMKGQLVYFCLPPDRCCCMPTLLNYVWRKLIDLS